MCSSAVTGDAIDLLSGQEQKVEEMLKLVKERMCRKTKFRVSPAALQFAACAKPQSWFALRLVSRLCKSKGCGAERSWVWKSNRSVSARLQVM